MGKDIISREQFEYNGESILIAYYKANIYGQKGIKCIINDTKNNYVVDIIPYINYGYISINMMSNASNIDGYNKIMKMMNDKAHETDRVTVVQTLIYKIFGITIGD